MPNSCGARGTSNASAAVTLGMCEHIVAVGKPSRCQRVRRLVRCADWLVSMLRELIDQNMGDHPELQGVAERERVKLLHSEREEHRARSDRLGEARFQAADVPFVVEWRVPEAVVEREYCKTHVMSSDIISTCDR